MENMEPKRTKLRKILDEKCLTECNIVIKYGRRNGVYLHFVFYLFMFIDFFACFIYLFTFYQIFIMYQVLPFYASETYGLSMCK